MHLKKDNRGRTEPPRERDPSNEKTFPRPATSLIFQGARAVHSPPNRFRLNPRALRLCQILFSFSLFLSYPPDTVMNNLRLQFERNFSSLSERNALRCFLSQLSLSLNAFVLRGGFANYCVQHSIGDFRRNLLGVTFNSLRIFRGSDSWYFSFVTGRDPVPPLWCRGRFLAWLETAVIDRE